MKQTSSYQSPLPYYQSPLPSINSSDLIDNKNMSKPLYLQSPINTTNYKYNVNSLSTYPHKTIYDFQNSSFLPKPQNIQYVDEIAEEKLTKSNRSLYPNVYNSNANYFIVTTRNNNQYQNSFSNLNSNINSNSNLNQYHIQSKNSDFDKKLNYITNSLESPFQNAPTLQSKPCFPHYNEDSMIYSAYNANYPTQNTPSQNRYIYNENEKENIYIVNNAIRANSALTIAPILPNENSKNDTLSNVPLSCDMKYQHSYIPQISDANLIKSNLNILFEKEYMDDININDKGVKTKKSHTNFKNPIKIMAACSPMWTGKEDILLKDLKDKQHLSWKEIATYFPTRTLNACQFRWRRLTIKEKNKIKIKHCKQKKLEQ